MAGPVPGVTITGFQRNGFQNNGFQIAGIGNGGKYFLLRPHYINNVYLDQWTTVTDGTEVPANCADGTCTTWGTNVTGGGGALPLLVWYNGAHWTLTGK